MTSASDDRPQGNDHNLSADLRGVRDKFIVHNRTKELCLQLKQDWDTYRNDRMSGKETGASPAHALKLEAMAIISALADFHCSCGAQLDAAGAKGPAHNWALDEGKLHAAEMLLSHIDTETL